MLNQILFEKSPDDLIFNPFDGGLEVLSAPEFLWRPRPTGKIFGFAASEHPQVNARIETHLSFTEKHRSFAQSIEFNTVPALVRDVSFKKSYVTVQDKCLLSGASGGRFLNNYCWKNEASEFDPEQALVAYFQACQSRAAHKSLTVVQVPPPVETPFAIECRNTFNFYHFVTESLCQLELVAESGTQGPIYFHYPNADDKTRLFVFAFIEALYPELADRVTFQRAPFHHEIAVVPYNFGPSYYQMPASISEGVDGFAPSHLAWKGRAATRSSHGVLSMNAVDSSLYKLRERALQAIEGKDFSHLPRRFWVGRDAGQARARGMRGENDIFEMLDLFGFKHVSFEKLTPLEQIAIMAKGEVMISYHGAGFTNMLFASQDMTVIELGTLQTAVTRWGDFWRMAIVSQCRYVSFFADHHTATPLVEPAFATDGIVPVHLSKTGLAQVMSFVVALLGRPPALKRIEDLRRVAGQLFKVGAVAQARGVIEANAEVVGCDVETNLTLAACCGAQEDYLTELSTLYLAYRADPARWKTLINVIWCARKLDDLDTVHAAIEIFRVNFPDKFQEFSKDRPWIKAQIEPLRRFATG